MDNLKLQEAHDLRFEEDWRKKVDWGIIFVFYFQALSNFCTYKTAH